MNWVWFYMFVSQISSVEKKKAEVLDRQEWWGARHASTVMDKDKYSLRMMEDDNDKEAPWEYSKHHSGSSWKTPEATGSNRIEFQIHSSKQKHFQSVIWWDFFLNSQFQSEMGRKKKYSNSWAIISPWFGC